MLVACYPYDFREGYGEPMVALFDDLCRCAWRRAGLGGLARLWVRTLRDFLTTIGSQYWIEWRQTMDWKNRVATVAGVLLLLYAFSFAAVNVLIYNLGFSNLWNPYSALIDPAQPNLFSWAMEGLLILSPGLAMAFLLLPSVGLRLDWGSETWAVVTLHRGSRLNMLLLGLCLLIGLVFALYLVGENFACLVGQQVVC